MKAKIIAAALSFVVATLPVQANTAPKEKPAQQTAIATAKIDLNKADVSTLTGSFKGIGKKRAEAIIAYRESHQGFKSIEELAEVKGLSQHFVTANIEKLKDVFIVK